MTIIDKIEIRDARFDLEEGAGSDAMHGKPQYGYAVTTLAAGQLRGTGLAYTLGDGTDLICHAIRILSEHVIGQDIEQLMSNFGAVQKRMADHHRLRWLGPHKGVTHLALASITNACFDLWAKSRGLPLWRLLLELSPEELVRLIDLSYCDDVLTQQDAINIVQAHQPSRSAREAVLESGYPGYDTSVGWINYDDAQLWENIVRAMDEGFRAVKLKVGSADFERDLRRARLIRDVGGSSLRMMFDANQAWPLPVALRACLKLSELDPFWIEEPTQPDDVLAHQVLSRAVYPVPIAVGEAVSNRVIWKNYLQAGAVGIVQGDCTRLAGISEYLAVTLMARKYPVRVVPHVGDMGQIHQHLVLFNHIALGHEKVFLEYIPHLREYFVHPAQVTGGVYRTPGEPGCGCELKPGVGELFA
jgi:L-fuconate dehydratase